MFPITLMYTVPAEDLELPYGCAYQAYYLDPSEIPPVLGPDETPKFKLFVDLEMELFYIGGNLVSTLTCRNRRLSAIHVVNPVPMCTGEHKAFYASILEQHFNRLGIRMPTDITRYLLTCALSKKF